MDVMMVILYISLIAIVSLEYAKISRQLAEIKPDLDSYEVQFESSGSILLGVLMVFYFMGWVSALYDFINSIGPWTDFLLASYKLSVEIGLAIIIIEPAFLNAFYRATSVSKLHWAYYYVSAYTILGLLILLGMELMSSSGQDVVV